MMPRARLPQPRPASPHAGRPAVVRVIIIQTGRARNCVVYANVKEHASSAVVSSAQTERGVL